MKGNWGGSWTNEKLEVFQKYVRAYLTIVESTRKKRRGWPSKVYYFDGFAGSGTRNKDSQDTNVSSQSIEIEKSEMEVYKGSAERVLSLDKKFDEYIFVDTDQGALDQLKEKLQSKQLDISNCQFIKNDVNEELKAFVNGKIQKNMALVFLDPFGMQVKWNTIENLKNKKIDLWILLPTGVIINRLLDRNGKLVHSKRLEEALGMEKDEIQKTFYTMVKDFTLFGEEERIQKGEQSSKEIAKVYINKLKGIFTYVTEKALELKNSKNVIIYHFIFGSNNKAAKKIATKIIEKQKNEFNQN